MTTINHKLMISISVVCLTLPMASAFAQQQTSDAHDEHYQVSSGSPVNAMCPIGKEPITKGIATVEYNGQTIGFCCAGCDKEFLAWDESKKDAFVKLALAKREPGQKIFAKAPAEDVRIGDPYLLNTCPVSGEKLGGMDETIVKIYEGREIRFCCKGCLKDFKADQTAYLAKADAQIIAAQMPYYPMQTCVVSGEPLEVSDMGDPINFVYMNRLIRFCCKGCKGDFMDDPETFLNKLDAAVIEQQSASYPLNTCPVSGEALDSMGGAIEKVYGNRLVRFCCTSCVKDFEATPAEYIATLDAAWKKNGGPPATATSMNNHDAINTHSDEAPAHDDHEHD